MLKKWTQTGIDAEKAYEDNQGYGNPILQDETIKAFLTYPSKKVWEGTKSAVYKYIKGVNNKGWKQLFKVKDSAGTRTNG